MPVKIFFTALVGVCSLALASSVFAQNGSTPPSNGSSDRGGTTYYPVTGNPSGSSAGVIVTPNPGTPSSAPSSSYGVGVQFPLPGGR